MPGSLSEWDEKHQAAAEEAPPEPASFVRELLPLLPMGPALDLACGTGRHTFLLASRRQDVTAVDGSEVALDVLERRARELHLGVNRIRNGGRIASSPHGIQLVHADLERLSLPATSFSLILCVHYLQRSLFAAMQAALMPGGILLFETYTRAQVESAGGPKNPAYLLEIGELRTAFPALRILFYRELRAGKGIASLIAQKAV
jgi:SAM-dependent methyltransferase